LKAYADTSFLVSLYVLDANSAGAAARIKPASLPIWLTPLSEVEIANAFCLRLFRKELDPAKIKAARSLFRQDLESGVFEIRPLSAAIFDTARRLAEQYTPRLGTRTLDLLHVASALVLQVEAFYTFDHHQGKLAKAEGLLMP
jgi:predicted nucleic acid-binding protein